MRRFLILLSLNFIACSLISQNLETEIELAYVKNSPDSVQLRAVLVDEDGVKLPGMEVYFYSTKNDSPSEVGKSMTNPMGEAKVYLKYSPTLFDSLIHRTEFSSKFMGNDEYHETESSIEIKDAVLRMEAEIIDSVNTLSFQLITWDEAGEEVGVEDGEIYIFVPRLFGLLPTGDAWTDENGEDAVKFPMDIPGGDSGELRIIAKIDEHEEFGNLETSRMTNWGVPTSEKEGTVRALWSDKPPLWMIITFIVLMSGVWLHYLYIIIKLRKIKSDGDEEDYINFNFLN